MEFEKIKEIVAKVLYVDPEVITMETRFKEDLMADSLDLVEVVMEIEDTFDVSLGDLANEEINTIGDAIELFNKLK